jgi:MFS family permease
MKMKAFYKWELLIWLWLAFFFNQADRQIFNVVMPLIKADLDLSDAQLGLISSLFVLTIGVFIPIAGFAGDLFSRKNIVCFSLFFWSAATLLTGTSTTLLHLVLFRSLAVGGGEAFYAPAANALISEFHQKTRALAMSVHQTSLYAGVILSGLLGGFFAESYGWKNTFYLFGGVGIILALFLFWRVKPSIKIADELNTGSKKLFLKQAASQLFEKPTALLLGSAFASLVFVNVGYLTWMPTFIHEKFNLSITEAGFNSMFYHHIFACAGVLMGGWISDRMALKGQRFRLVIQSMGLFIGAPFIFALGQAETPFMTYAWLAGFGFFRGIYEANLYTTLFSVIAPAFRATSIGLISMFAFIISALAPFLLGYLKPTLGLSDGLSSLCVAYVVGGVCILIAFRYFFQKDCLPVSADQ